MCMMTPRSLFSFLVTLDGIWTPLILLAHSRTFLFMSKPLSTRNSNSCNSYDTKNTSILLCVMGYQFTGEGKTEVLFSSQYNALKCLKLELQFPVRVPLSAQHRTMLIQHHYNFKSGI